MSEIEKTNYITPKKNIFEVVETNNADSKEKELFEVTDNKDSIKIKGTTYKRIQLTTKG